MSLLTLLGTGTCQLEHERRASSVLLELDGTLILFDCGHGVAQRLLDAGVQHQQLQHIVLSHFHPDHVSDLIPLLQAGAWSQRNPRQADLHIYGPTGVHRLVDGLMKLFGASSLQRSHYSIVVHEITAPAFSIEGHTFTSVPLPPAGNHGLRFTYRGKTYVLTGDSYVHEEEIAALKDVDIAVIDAGHPSDEELVALAAATQARVIVCSHLYRPLNRATLQAAAEQKGYRGTFIIGHDLLSFVL
jgi:ribonuclease BN (tRNA processing enzyme)